jgi:hypothetical protein
VYIEDTIEPNFLNVSESSSRGPLYITGESNQASIIDIPGLSFIEPGYSINHFSGDTLVMAVRGQAIQILGSLETMFGISVEFFVGAHQRFPVICKHRFEQNLKTLETNSRVDFLVLCLCIHLIQQFPPGNGKSMQSSLYFTVKNLIGLLETTNNISLDLVHCRLLVTYYEIGHGLHTAAYISIATCARVVRVIGLHRKDWRYENSEKSHVMEEKKRMWWAIVNMDRFINLCFGDAQLVAADPELLDPLPIQDLLWLEDPTVSTLNYPENAAPVLGTAVSITVGQMARECQVSHLAGRVVRLVFDPSTDQNLNSEIALQLERTLMSFLLLLQNEELKIGRYCGALGIAHRYD